MAGGGGLPMAAMGRPNFGNLGGMGGGGYGLPQQGFGNLLGRNPLQGGLYRGGLPSMPGGLVGGGGMPSMPSYGHQPGIGGYGGEIHGPSLGGGIPGVGGVMGPNALQNPNARGMTAY